MKGLPKSGKTGHSRSFLRISVGEIGDSSVELDLGGGNCVGGVELFDRFSCDKKASLSRFIFFAFDL